MQSRTRTESRRATIDLTGRIELAKQ
jgi:hypothetical protein